MKKAILFSLTYFSIIACAHSQNYQYNKVISMQQGADCFAFDYNKVKIEKGTISINSTTININNKSIKIKKQLSENLYKAKGCKLHYIYFEGKVAAIEVIKSSLKYYYIIDDFNEKNIAIK